MNQKSISFLIIVAIFLFGCASHETKTSGLLDYKNADLGISFKYPKNFNVYQSDKDNLRVVSNYKNAKHSAVEIVMGIRRASTKRESPEEIEKRINPDISVLTDLINNLQNQISNKEYYNEALRQTQYSQKSNPEIYKSLYGDKTPEEVVNNQIQEAQK